ncbi:MAG: hypothetical protein COB67_05070 [SAR324 cluster bacterium]|uniref:Probable molybdenum cofactor guanylyltransferase n=1 Tax=SAR324 cluster bacterium TaxID=2024889 RepID=A0A2A4T6Y1_9DELT|nr:MAG: hypothetical protein COB67_05070 [SAR324 cluster bacterium]
MIERTAVILLAGGLSSRMGRDKANLRLQGRTQLDHLLETLEPLVSESIVMLADQQAMPELTTKLKHTVKIGRDRVAQQGPLQGIADALPLIASQIERVLVVTCDLPYLSLEWLRALHNALQGDVDAVCTLAGGYKNALLGCYRKKVLEKAPEILLEGKKRPVFLWEGSNVLFLEPAPDKLLNCQDMNTPEEYQKAQEFFSAKAEFSETI